MLDCLCLCVFTAKQFVMTCDIIDIIMSYDVTLCQKLIKFTTTGWIKTFILIWCHIMTSKYLITKELANVRCGRCVNAQAFSFGSLSILLLRCSMITSQISNIKPSQEKYIMACLITCTQLTRVYKTDLQTDLQTVFTSQLYVKLQVESWLGTVYSCINKQMHFAVITFNFLIQSNISFSYLNNAA